MEILIGTQGSFYLEAQSLKVMDKKSGQTWHGSFVVIGRDEEDSFESAGLPNPSGPRGMRGRAGAVGGV